MRRIAVGDVMTRNFVSAGPNANLHECAKLMAKERVDSLIIRNKNKLLGILTARDILWVITKKAGLNLKEVNCMEIATKKLAVIKPSAEISQALEKMKTLNFRRLPVLSHGELLGVVTLKDILAVEPELYSDIQSLMGIREEERKRKRVEDEWPLEGMCENCGSFSELLKVEDRLLCPDCRDEIY